MRYCLPQRRERRLFHVVIGDEDEDCEFPVGVVQAHPTPPVGHRVGGVADGTHHFNPGYGAIGPGEVIVYYAALSKIFLPFGGKGDGVLQHEFRFRGDLDSGLLNQVGGVDLRPFVKVLLGDCPGFDRHIPPGDCLMVCRFDGEFRVDKKLGFRRNHRVFLRMSGGWPRPPPPHCPRRSKRFQVDDWFVAAAFGNDAGGGSYPDRAHHHIGGIGVIEQKQPNVQQIGLIFLGEGSTVDRRIIGKSHNYPLVGSPT